MTFHTKTGAFSVYVFMYCECKCIVSAVIFLKNFFKALKSNPSVILYKQLDPP